MYAEEEEAGGGCEGEGVVPLANWFMEGAVDVCAFLGGLVSRLSTSMLRPAPLHIVDFSGCCA